MAIRFFVGHKDAPTEGAVQSKKLEFKREESPQVRTEGCGAELGAKPGWNGSAGRDFSSGPAPWVMQK
jgi:hypothetical protein